MERMQIDLEYLVEQTMNYRHEPEVTDYPSGPGVIFAIEKEARYFRFHTQVTGNIEATMSNKKEIRISDDFDIYFFETDYIELAEVISDQLKRKRFPLEEDTFYNISDPGFNWWMKISDNKFKIFFHSHGFEENEEFVKLGPLGDPCVATTRFEQMREVLKTWFPLNQLRTSDKFLELSVLRESDGTIHHRFKKLREIFLSGSSPKELYDSIDGGLAPTYYFYFSEVAAMRRFWKEAVKLL